MDKDYGKSILEAVLLLIENNNKQLKFDKTIICEIYKQSDLSIGEYLVKFENNIFNVYVEDSQTVYNIGDSVYVLVPEGDMSNRKNVIGKTSNSTFSTTGYNYELIPKSQNLISEQEQEYLVGTLLNSLNTKIYENKSGEKNNWLISNLSSKYDIIRISADFLTINTNKDNLENYGLVIEFLAADEKTNLTYWLDINNFIGNPYLLTEYTHQYIDIEVVKGSIANINKIYLSATPGANNSSLFTVKAKNIKIEFMELINYNEQLYYSNIVSLNGIEKNYSQDLTLQAIAKYCGTNILTSSTSQINWYEKDINGWKLINNSTDSFMTVEFNKLIIPRQTVWNSKEIKAEIIYNNNIILESTIIVYENLATNENQELITMIDSKGKTYLLPPFLNASYSYLWTLETLDGKIYPLDFDIKTYSLYLTDEQLSQAKIIISCKIIDNHRFIVLSKTLTNMKDKGDLYVEFLGETRFEYDEKGAKFYDETDKIRTIEPVLVWADDKAGYCDIKWCLGELNKEPVYTLSNEPLENLTNSMFSEIWVNEKDNKVCFKLSKKFEPTKNNNVLTLFATSASGKVFKYVCPFEFIKIGNLESVGVNFQTVIRTSKEGNGFLEALVFEDDIQFKEKGLKITTENYIADEYIWSILSQIFDLKQDINNKNKVLVVLKEKLPEEITDYSTVISVQVGITELLDINQNNQLDKVYCYYNYPVITKVEENNSSYSILSENYFLQSQFFCTLTFPLSVYYTLGNNPVSTITKDFVLGYMDDPAIYYYDLRLTKNLGIINSLIKNRYNYIPPKTFDYTLGTECLEVGVLNDNDNFETKYYITIMLQNSVKGLENINGYNGTTLEGTKEPVIDEDTLTIKKDPVTQEELYVPSLVHNLLLGVGELTNGEFTGVVMGMVENKEKETTKKLGGLYGYDKGINTFGLTQEGKAYFGPKGKGRIEIDGTLAKIIGGGGGYLKNGMTIDLYGGDPEPSIDEEGNEIKTYKNYAINVNKEAFCVDYNGNGRVSGFAFDENGLYTVAYIPQEDGTYRIDFPKSANEAFDYYPESTIIHESLGIRAPGMYFSDPYNKQMLIGSLGAGKGISGSDPTNVFNFSSSRGIRIFASGEEQNDSNDQTSKDIAIISKKGTIWLLSANHTISLDLLINRIEALENRPIVPIA